MTGKKEGDPSPHEEAVYVKLAFFAFLLLLGAAFVIWQYFNPGMFLREHIDEITIVENVQRIQNLRKTWLNRACHDMRDGSTKNNAFSTRALGNRTLTHMLVDDKHKVLYCFIPKAGCSTWRSLLLNLYNNKSIPVKTIHSPISMQSHGITSLKNYSREEMIFRLNTYYKFMFVRHPLTRLVSAFRDKFTYREDHLNQFFDLLVPTILNHSHRFDPKTYNRLNTTPSFEEVLSYIFSPSGYLSNEHWDTMESLCSPCVIKYDFIGELETFEQDSNYLLSEVFHSDLSVPAVGRRTGTNSSVAMAYFQTLSSALRANVTDNYVRDAQLFNYDLNTF